MRTAMKTLRSPVPKARIAILELPTGQIGIRAWENDIMGYDVNSRAAIMEHMKMMKSLLESFGADVILEGVPGDPPW